jgi:PAS domain S-box-containing protein
MVGESPDNARTALINPQFQLLLEKLPSGAYTCDAEGLITYYNQAAVRIWGRAPKLNDPVDRFCGSMKLYSISGAAIEHDQCWMALALREQREYDGQEIVVERPDGTRVTALAHANPLHDDSGRLLGAVNFLVDITESVKSGEVRALLASVVESCNDAIVTKTLDGRILSWNKGAERLFGFPAHEAIGAPITIIVPADRHGEEDMILARLRRGERIENYETVRVSRDGQLLDVSITTSPIRDGTGRIVGASKVARDISARKRSEEALKALRDRLQEADRRKDEFLAMLAHELRNPLAPISNSVQILRMTEALDPAVSRLSEIIDRQVTHMARLIDDLLDASRITQGKISLRREIVELATIISNAVETTRPTIEAPGHQFAISLSPEVMTLNADSVRLAQVIANLLTNAAKFTPPGGQIWLTARREGNEAIVSVRDTGLGIPREMQSRVFEMFAQVHSPAERQQGGLGIGLALARRFIEMHEGRIEVTSAGPGQGSEFIIHLPLIPDAMRALPREPHRVVPKVSLPARRILVVDDARAAVYTMGKLLEKLGQDVRTSGDGETALEMARAEPPDVVISDLGMPNLDGYEFARRLRQEPGLDKTVLVAVTGFGQEEDRQRAKEAGFEFHLVKPVSIQVLQDLLISLTSSGRWTRSGAANERG